MRLPQDKRDTFATKTQPHEYMRQWNRRRARVNPEKEKKEGGRQGRVRLNGMKTNRQDNGFATKQKEGLPKLGIPSVALENHMRLPQEHATEKRAIIRQERERLDEFVCLKTLLIQKRKKNSPMPPRQAEEELPPRAMPAPEKNKKEVHACCTTPNCSRP